jgi:hypothetical protein
MPIRINLLAEQREAEEQRRRDPAKRALWVGGFLVGLLVLWAGYLQVRVAKANGQVASVEAQFKQLEAKYNLVRTNQQRVATLNRKMTALQQLATNRFLWATPLNTLQFTVVPNVQLVRLRTEQVYTVTEASKPITNASAGVKVTPASIREKALLRLDAKDFSAVAGDQIPRFLDALNTHPSFQSNQMKAELTGRTVPQTDSGGPSTPFVLFTVDCQYAERTR